MKDAVVNRVHQDILAPDVAQLHREPPGEEVKRLAGRDNWLRPATVATGFEGSSTSSA